MGVKISELPSAGALTGIEKIPLANGDTEYTTPADLKTYMQSNLSLITSGTAQATTSGTSIDFTSIPSTVKRITVMLSGVSTNGTSLHLLQIGDSGGIETSGYDSSITTSGADANASTGFLVGYNGNAADTVNGIVTLTLLDASANTWVCGVATGRGAGSSAQTGTSGGGSKSLSATLDRIRLTTVGGANTFDAGKINILYE